MQPRQTFTKEERLCSKKLIEELFAGGHSFFEYPFKIVYLIVDEDSPWFKTFPAKVLFTISKRKFKLATDRNKLKRLMREGYRKQKYLLYKNLSSKKIKTGIAYIYTAKEMLPYQEIEKKIKTSIVRLKQDIDKNTK